MSPGISRNGLRVFLREVGCSLRAQALACDHEAQECSQAMVGFWRGKAAGLFDAAKRIESYLTEQG